MKTKVTLAAALLLQGCATAPHTAEAVWQSAHLIDTIQTIKGPASDQCYVEGDPTTRLMIGREPSATAVAAWGVGFAAFHWLVSSWLSDHAPAWAYWTWQGLSFADVGYSVARNYSVGIRIGRPNSDFPACPQWARGVAP